MNRRGFLGALAALGGAAATKKLAPEVPPPAPVLPAVTSGYLQVVNADLNGQAYTLTTNAVNGNMVYLDYDAHMRGEGIRWNYTAGQVQS